MIDAATVGILALFGIALMAVGVLVAFMVGVKAGRTMGPEDEEEE